MAKKNEDLSLLEEIRHLKAEIKELKKTQYYSFKSLYDFFPHGILTANKEGYYLDANSMMCKMLGYTHSELVGLHSTDIIAPEGTEHISPTLNTSITENDYQQTWTFVHKDGSTFNAGVMITKMPNGNLMALVQDNSDKNKFENELIESIEKYQSLYENAPLAYQSLNEDGSFRDVNPAWLNILGYSMDEVIGKNYKDFLHPEWAKLFPARFKKFKAQGQVSNVHFKIRHKDGHYLDIKFEGCIGYNSDGTVRQTYCVFQDATEDMRNQERLHQFEHIVSSSTDMLALFDTNYRCLRINEAYSSAFNLSKDEIIGSTTSQIFGKELFDSEIKEKVDECLLGRKVRYQLWIDFPGKVKKFMEVTYYPYYDETKTVVGYVVNGRDITKRRQIEEVLVAEKLFSESLVSNLPGVFYLISEEGRFLRWNTEFEEVTGRSAEEMARISPIDLFEGEDKQAIAAAIQKVFTQGQVQVKASFVAKDGKRIPYQFSGAKIIVDNAPTLIGLGMDITEQHQAEMEMIEAKEKAEESDRLKSSFLANMSHEIRTPMNGILGFSELLKEPDLTGEEQLSYISVIEKSGERMLNTINNLIEISKIEVDQVVVNITEVDVNVQMQDVFNFFRLEIEEKGLSFKMINPESENDLTISTDGEKLYGIFINLIRNSVKYTSEGDIEFGLKKTESNLEFFVKDTGIGIAMEDQESVFERFVQVEMTKSRMYEGSGLGLAITKANVELLGGEIWFESVIDKGTTFYFNLPNK